VSTGPNFTSALLGIRSHEATGDSSHISALLDTGGHHFRRWPRKAARSSSATRSCRPSRWVRSSWRSIQRRTVLLETWSNSATPVTASSRGTRGAVVGRGGVPNARSRPESREGGQAPPAPRAWAACGPGECPAAPSRSPGRHPRPASGPERGWATGASATDRRAFNGGSPSTGWRGFGAHPAVLAATRGLSGGLACATVVDRSFFTASSGIVEGRCRYFTRRARQHAG
jgi:hypothetical protein